MNGRLAKKIRKLHRIYAKNLAGEAQELFDQACTFSFGKRIRLALKLVIGSKK